MPLDTVRVYIDFKSPYSYVAVRPLVELAQSEAIVLDWRPYTLRLERAAAGGQAEVIYPMRKIRYLYADVRRFAGPQGLVIKGPQRIFDGTTSSIGMLYAQDHGVFEGYRDLAFERFFKRELDIDSVAQIAAVLGEAGADAADFTRFAQGEGRQRHDAIQREAEAEGVFGVPSMLHEGELFWGGDRIELLRERLRAARTASP